MSETYMNIYVKNIYVKKPHFTQNINYNELRIYEEMSKKISLQYQKMITCNISVSESSGCITPVNQQVSELPADIEKKLSMTSYENPSWHTDADKQHTSAISCKISQMQYLS